MKKLGIMIAVVMVVASAVQAQLAIWENDDVLTATNSTPVDVVAADMSAGVLALGPGLANPSGHWDNSLWAFLSDAPAVTNLSSAISNNRYFSFTVTPDLGKQADYTNVAVRVTLNDSESAGASVQIVLMSSATGFTDGDEIGSFVASTPAGEITDNGLINMDISAVVALQDQPSEVEFRLYVVLNGGAYSRVALGHIFFADAADDVRVDGIVEDAATLPIVKLASWDNDSLSLGATGTGETNNAAEFVEAGIAVGDLAQSYRWANQFANWKNSMWALCSDLGNVTNLATAIFEDRYFNFVMQPEAGKQADYTKVSVRITMNSAGNLGTSATYVLMSSITGFNDGDEIGSFVAVHNPADGGATDNGLLEMDISGVAALQNITGEVEFRVYLILNDQNSNRWGIGHIFFADDADDVVVNGRIEDAPYMPATILSWASVSDSVMKLVIDAPSAPVLYYPKGTVDLVIQPWAGVAHSDNDAGPFEITNLTVSATEGDNKVIYVETTETQKFFGIGQE